MTDKHATLTFHGGAGSVTGANFLLETGKKKILIDCGLIQGGEFSDVKNWNAFPYDPASIDALFVTHAHTDHIGRIPRLVARGFRGPIYSTPPTKDIAALMFDDALKVMREELARRKDGREPLYDENNIAQTLALWKTVSYHEYVDAGDGVRAQFLDAGHILGSAIVAVECRGRSIAFSGDLGNDKAPLARPTEALEHVQYLVMESVYGDRNHEGTDTRREALGEAIKRVQRKNGTLLIPAFSLERTQILLYEIGLLVEEGRINPIRVFLDAPLAIRVLDVYRRYPEYLSDEVQAKLKEGDPFSFKGLTLTANAEGSRGIYASPNPKIIIAGSGMSNGGRIRTHERDFLSDPSTTILFPGYQAAGSLGRRLVEGAKKVRIDNEWVRVRARVEQLHGYSAHKDMDGLIAFVEQSTDTLEQVFVAMGEPHASLFLTQRLRDFLGVNAVAPAPNQSFTVNW